MSSASLTQVGPQVSRGSVKARPENAHLKDAVERKNDNRKNAAFPNK